MTQYMGVNEAVQALRGKFFTDRSFRGLPEEAHQINFAKEVAKQLSGNDDAATVIHVMALLREEGIELPAGQEYPKYATRLWDKTAKIVQDEQEEHDWINEPQPDPADAPQALREQVQPVQDLSLDLTKQVPGHSHQDDPAKVPSAITNREAAQDAYARQPVEGTDRDEAAAAYDPGPLGQAHQDAIDGQDDFDDDEVHVEHVDLDDKAPNADKSKGGATYAKPADVGVFAHDDPDRDGIAGQDKNPTHDSVLGTEVPQRRSGDSSAGKTDTNRRPVGTGKNPNKRPE